MFTLFIVIKLDRLNTQRVLQLKFFLFNKDIFISQKLQDFFRVICAIFCFQFGSQDPNTNFVFENVTTVMFSYYELSPALENLGIKEFSTNVKFSYRYKNNHSSNGLFSLQKYSHLSLKFIHLLFLQNLSSQSHAFDQP